MNHHDHVWANGALVCNCGARRKDGAAAMAPPGWPGEPSEPVCNTADTPVHVSLTVGVHGSDPANRIVVGGVDLTHHCRGFKVEAAVGAVPAVWLDLIGVTVQVEADVPPDYVKEMTLEEDEANQVARQTKDIGRSQKSYPRALVAVSLGQVKP